MTAAIILGAAVRPDGSASPTLRRRTLHAVALFESGQVSQLICSGGLGQYPPSEAAVMRDICLAEGLPQDAILLEDRSRNTLENLANAKPLLPDPKETEVLIVTDHYHKARALLTARHLGISARASCPALRGTAWHRVAKSWLREIPALIYYCWRFSPLSGRPTG